MIVVGCQTLVKHTVLSVGTGSYPLDILKTLHTTRELEYSS